jgi:hypothetical protein
MGLLDGDYSSQTYGLLGMLQGLAPYMQATRTPTSPFAGLAGAGAGLMQGEQGYLQNRYQRAMLGPALFKAGIYDNILKGGDGSGSAMPSPGVPGPSPTQSGLGFGGAPMPGTGDPASAAAPQNAPPAMPGGQGGVPPMAPQGGQGGGYPSAGPTGPNSFYGHALPPGMGIKDLMAWEAAVPGSAKEILTANTPKPYLGGERPGVPLQRYNPQTGRYEMESYVPTPIQGANLVPVGGGQYGFSRAPGASANLAENDAIAQGAIGARERGVKRFENTLEFGGLGVGGGGGGQGAGGPGPLRTSGGPLSAPALPSGKPIVTEQGTTIPPATEQAPINRAGAYLKDALPEWSKTETAWSAALPNLSAADVQMNAIADALKKTQSGSFATDKADIAAKLKAVGIELPASVWGDPAQVQIALKNNAVGTLNTLKGTTSRFTQMEFDRISKALANPDLQPEAALSILSESLGQIHSGMAQANDWAAAKQAGWQNPIDFQRAWTKANPTQKFVDQAKAQIGPLKGMPGGPSNAPTQPVRVGTTAIDRSGARVKWDGMKWNPM